VFLSIGDPDVKRKQVVREKTAQYLLQAEKIYNQHLASKSAELSLWDVRILTFCWTLRVETYCQQATFLKCYSILMKDTWPQVDNNYVEQISGINYDAHCPSDSSVCLLRLAGNYKLIQRSIRCVISFSIYFHYLTFIRYDFEVWCHCPLYTCQCICITHNL
jgi:hypothetical protein